jgi:cytidyltransferase-like protein
MTTTNGNGATTNGHTSNGHATSSTTNGNGASNTTSTSEVSFSRSSSLLAVSSPYYYAAATAAATTATNNGGTSSSSTSSSSSNGNLVTRTTEGWLELFLTTPEKYAFSQWNEQIKNNSLTHYLFQGIFNYVAHHQYIPDSVAPNLLSLLGLLLLAQAWYLTNMYAAHYPTACSWLAVVSILTFFTTSSMQEAHATRTRQRTALGDLFKYSCDAAATVFLSILTVYCLGGSTNHETQWYVVQFCQLVLFLKHLSAFHRQAGLRYNVVTGPGEVLLTCVLLLATRATFGLEWLLNLYEGTIYRLLDTVGPQVVYHSQQFQAHVHHYADAVAAASTLAAAAAEATAATASSNNNNNHNNISTISVKLMTGAAGAMADAVVSLDLEKYRRDPLAVASEAAMYAYYTIYLVAVLKTLRLQAPHGWSRFGLSASLLMRVIPALLFHVAASDSSTTTTDGSSSSSYELCIADVICDGLFMAVLTSDVTLAKMAGREVHPWVVVMSLAAVLSHTSILTLCLVYYIAVFCDLCSYLNMPLLTTCRNVYCDGVYDLCHVGHKRLFQNALQYGNRLFVGVVGDEDAMNYKRPPIMTHAERCAEVMGCKAVTKVIPNAPCFGLTVEFLERHQIHVVAYGQEYLERYPDPKDDPYYRIPRELGMARPLPRTEGLSTSDLIRRIQTAPAAEEKKSPT